MRLHYRMWAAKWVDWIISPDWWRPTWSGRVIELDCKSVPSRVAVGQSGQLPTEGMNNPWNDAGSEEKIGCECYTGTENGAINCINCDIFFQFHCVDGRRRASWASQAEPQGLWWVAEFIEHRERGFFHSILSCRQSLPRGWPAKDAASDEVQPQDLCCDVTRVWRRWGREREQKCPRWARKGIRLSGHGETYK